IHRKAVFSDAVPTISETQNDNRRSSTAHESPFFDSTCQSACFGSENRVVLRPSALRSSFREGQRGWTTKLLDPDNDALIARERRCATIGCFQNYVDGLAGLGVIGQAERRCQRRRIGKCYVARVGACIVVLPPSHSYRIVVGVRNVCLETP